MQELKINLDNKIEVPNPEVGDFNLKVYPINHKNPVLPTGFEMWMDTLKEMLSHIPYQDDCPSHFITITSQFLTSTMAIRRTGMHIDGNFCVDPSFQFRSWGGTGWAGLGLSRYAQEKFKKDGKWTEFSDNRHVTKKWHLNSNVVIPYGKYVTPDLGGLITISSLEGCTAYQPDKFDETRVFDEGSLDKDYSTELEEGNKFMLPKDTMSIMSSNFPHCSEAIEAGNRRTLIRITLGHNYKNNVLFH